LPTEIAPGRKDDVGQETPVAIPRVLGRVTDQPDAPALSETASPNRCLRSEAFSGTQLRRVDPDQPDSLAAAADEAHVERVAVNDTGDSPTQGEATCFRTRRRRRTNERDGDPRGEAEGAEAYRLQ
jgi:hypothetical protein